MTASREGGPTSKRTSSWWRRRCCQQARSRPRPKSPVSTGLQVHLTDTIVEFTVTERSAELVDSAGFTQLRISPR